MRFVDKKPGEMVDFVMSFGDICVCPLQGGPLPVINGVMGPL